MLVPQAIGQCHPLEHSRTFMLVYFKLNLFKSQSTAYEDTDVPEI